VLAVLSSPSTDNRCLSRNITDDIRAIIRSYQFCDTQTNLSTPDQVASFYEQGVQDVVALVIATKMDVISLVNSSSTIQDLMCPYSASVYDSCTDGMCLVSKMVVMYGSKSLSIPVSMSSIVDPRVSTTEAGRGGGVMTALLECFVTSVFYVGFCM